MNTARFMKYISKQTNGCWYWTGGKTKKGYGKCAFFGKTVDAHRVSYILFNGSIPKDKIVCHSCDIKVCVNPEHLTLGTYKSNMQDAKNRGRRIGAIPQRSDADILKIFSLRKSGMLQREIAALYNTSQGYIGLILQGKLRPDVKERLDKIDRPLQVRGDI